MTLAAPELRFPTLDGGLAYLDSAATSQTPLPVLEAMDDYYRSYRASVHRGVYDIAAQATEHFEGARAKAAALVGSTAARDDLHPQRDGGDQPRRLLVGPDRARRGRPDRRSRRWSTTRTSCRGRWPRSATARRSPTSASTTTAGCGLDDLDALLAREPKLVGVTHVSNVLGTINDIAEITRRAHAAGAVVMVDGSQAVPHLPVDVGDVDFYAWTGHKAYGPTGIGVLHGRRALLEAMPPFLGGGHMIVKVGEQSSTYTEVPARFEAGTSAVAEGIGLGAACDFLAGIGMERIAEHDAELATYALERLGEVPGLIDPRPARARRHRLLRDRRVSIPHDVAEILGSQGVCVRAGHHCAQPLMRRLGTPATSRASFSIHSTRDDVDRLVDGLGRVREIFGLA